MSTTGAWLRSAMKTWAILLVSVLLVTPFYTSIAFGGERPDAVLASVSALVLLLVVIGAVRLWLNVPLGDLPSEFAPLGHGAPASAVSFRVLDTSQSLRTTFKALQIEGVTGFEFVDPVGQTNLLVHVPANRPHATVMGQILPSLGEDPIAIVTMIEQKGPSTGGADLVDDVLLLASFSAELAWDVVRAANAAALKESGSRIEAIQQKDAKALFRLATAAQEAYLGAFNPRIG